MRETRPDPYGSDGKRIDYAYDTGNMLSTVAIPGEGSIVYNSYNWTAPTKVSLPGGSTKNYAYDGLLRPTLIHMKDPAKNTLMRYAYSYDAAGNITVKNTEYGSYSFGYDSLDRLTSANYPASQPALTNETFGYDKVGNRVKHNSIANPWSYNANNELTARPNVTYTYDANGSQIKKTENGVVTDYIYSGENRLSRVKQGANIIASYQYDPFGRRISKTAGGATIYFYYTDEGLAAEADGTGKVLVSYGYQPGGIWGTDPLYTSINGAYHYYLNDHLGTPQQLAQKNGARTWAAIYEAFGKATITTSTITNNFRFPGQYFDAETGLDYNYFRTYDPVTGRYTQHDLIGLNGGMNPFGYVNGNPINGIDPFGLATFVCIKPLHAFGGSGNRSGPDIPGNPLYHKFLCVKNGGPAYCGGQDRSGLPFSPGKPSTDSFPVPGGNGTCRKADERSCVDICVQTRLANPTRPFYGIGPGTDCQEFADQVLGICQTQCGQSVLSCGSAGCITK